MRLTWTGHRMPCEGDGTRQATKDERPRRPNQFLAPWLRAGWRENHHHPVRTPHLALDEPRAMSNLDLFIVDVALRAIGHADCHEGALTLSWEG